ncbi:MAG TPA: hypothetical protein VFX96_09030 [Pyrinomonadaceae bacterium]|nr:hypothetical protein [Pyrinomonadaceae bacterium]
MSKEQSTVPDIFRRAQELLRAEPEMKLKDLRMRLVGEYRGAPMPPTYNLTIPEQDARAPEEDWSAGLSLVMRGIQREDWPEIINGIVLSLEQTVRYERERGPVGAADHWHDRSAGIRSQVEKGVSKWMPEELVRMAERSTKK